LLFRVAMSTHATRAISAGILLALLHGSVARAHIALIAPEPRTTQLKDGPCGEVGGTRGPTVAVFEPGQTITLRWAETVDHGSHYRIAFDVDGEDDFVPPTERTDLYNSPAVLADDIADGSGGTYAQAITLPDVECERCTIQLIQVMYGSGNYFQCADIAIRRAGGPPPSDAGAAVGVDAGVAFTDDAASPTGSGDAAVGSPPPSPGGRSTLVGSCSASPSRHRSRAAPWLLLAIGLLGLSLRRRRPRRTVDRTVEALRYAHEPRALSVAPDHRRPTPPAG
jgi:hypothetical protein